MTTGTTRILLVEDNRAEAVLMQGMLTGRSTAFEVVWADRLAPAIAALADTSFAAVLLDLTLPDSHGLTTLGRITDAAPAMPVIVVTGIEDEELAIAAIRSGAQDYLVKDGLTGFAVARAIRYAVDRKRIDQALRTSEARVKLLAQMASRLLAADDPLPVINDACRAVMAHLDCHVFLNYLTEAESTGLPGKSEPGEATADGAPSATEAGAPRDMAGGPAAGAVTPMHGPRLRLNAWAGISDAEAAQVKWLDYGAAVSGCVARDGACIVVDDIQRTADPRGEAVRGWGVQAYCSHPLQAQGRMLGTLAFGTRSRSRFTHEDVAMMKNMADQVAVALQRMESQRALERAKQEWERTFDSVPDLIAILDDRHRIRRANRAMAERLHTTPALCIGQPCHAAVHGAACPPGNCPHVLTMADGKEHLAQVHEERLGGDFLVSTTPLHDREGRWFGAVHVARDITELKRAQQREQEALALASASQTAVDVLDAMGEGVLLLDMAGRILSINPALEKMSGIPAGDVVGQPFRHVFPELLSAGDQAFVSEALTRAMKGHLPTLPTLTLLNRDGQRIPVLAAVSFVRNAGYQPTAIVATLRNISEMRAMEKMVESSERKYRELVENANSIIMRITPDHDVVFFNEYAQRFFGYTAEEILGKNVLGTIVPEVESTGRDLRKMLRGITTHPELHGSNENENMRKDGGRMWVHWANRAIRDNEGRVIELLCVGTDVTERKRAEAEKQLYQDRLRRLAERLAASEEQERWRISRYIHDTIVQNLSLSCIKLGSLLTSSEKLRTDSEGATLLGVRKLIDDAVSECRSVMSELTPSLLYDLGLVPALSDLAEKIQERHKVRVFVEETGDTGSMDNAIRGLLFQSTREFVMNALKHAGESDIHISVTRQDQEIIVQVRDGGKGFDPVKLARQAGVRGGFGLFSVRERVEGLGGRLEIVSAPGLGTTAKIVVPLAKAG